MYGLPSAAEGLNDLPDVHPVEIILLVVLPILEGNMGGVQIIPVELPAHQDQPGLLGIGRLALGGALDVIPPDGKLILVPSADTAEIL